MQVRQMSATLLVILVVLVAGRGHAADRRWQTGTWADAGIKRTPWVGDPRGTGPWNTTPTKPEMPEVATYVIETADWRLELQDIAPIGRGSFDLNVTVGAPVTFALSGKTAYIRKADGTEYRLRVVKKRPRTKP